MKDCLILFTMGILSATSLIISWNSFDIKHKLDKLIELNTPEYINVIPDKILEENK